MTPISSPADLAARFERLRPDQRAYWLSVWAGGDYRAVLTFVENTITEPSPTPTYAELVRQQNWQNRGLNPGNPLARGADVRNVVEMRR